MVKMVVLIEYDINIKHHQVEILPTLLIKHSYAQTVSIMGMLIDLFTHIELVPGKPDKPTILLNSLSKMIF